MNFSHFFIRRPIFAGVLSIIIFVLGLIAMGRLPISEYPEVVPPTIVVRATYPGANPKTIAETVASPLEQAVNGVEDSLYMFSQATGDGDDADGHVQARHGHRQGPGAGAKPGCAGASQTARGSPPARCDDRQAIARPHVGGPPVLAQRSLRRSLSPQLRHLAGQGRFRAHPRRR